MQDQSDGVTLRIDEWNQDLYACLWIRAALGIETSPDAEQPAALAESAQVPHIAGTGTQHAQAWAFWWAQCVRRTVTLSQSLPTDRLLVPGIRPPEFAGLAGYPRFRDVIQQHWRPAYAWAAVMRRAGTSQTRFDTVDLIRRLEAEQTPLKHRSLVFFVLPVRSATTQRIGPEQYLISRNIYESTKWEDIVRHGLQAA